MSERIAIISATSDELDPVLRSLEGKEARKKGLHHLHTGVLDSREVAALCCGVGKVNAGVGAQILIDEYSPKCLIMMGVAGGVDPELRIGDVVISTKLYYHDVGGDFLTAYHPHLPKYFSGDEALLRSARKAAENLELHFGTMVTGDVFIEHEGRDDIITRFSPMCVDMESAAAAHACVINKLPFIAVRGISDTEAESGVGNFQLNCVKSSKKAFAALREIIKNC